MRSDAARSVRKALLVLEEVASRQPVTVASLARVLKLPKTTVQRSLTTLGEAGWLVQSDGDRSWSLSTKVASLAQRTISGFTLQQAAAEPMHRLRDLTNESVLLVERSGSSAAIIDIAPTTQVVQAVATLGTLLPLHASAGGKALLAATVEHADLEPLTRFTDATVVDPDALRAELDAIRARGWAVQDREFEGTVSSVAAAIRPHPQHDAVAAVVLYGPASRLTTRTVERVAPLVVQTADEIARRLRT